LFAYVAHALWTLTFAHMIIRKKRNEEQVPVPQVREIA
jgi:hypothetical protein